MQGERVKGLMVRQPFQVSTSSEEAPWVRSRANDSKISLQTCSIGEVDEIATCLECLMARPARCFLQSQVARLTWHVNAAQQDTPYYQCRFSGKIYDSMSVGVGFVRRPLVKYRRHSSLI